MAIQESEIAHVSFLYAAAPSILIAELPRRSVVGRIIASHRHSKSAPLVLRHTLPPNAREGHEAMIIATTQELCDLLFVEL